MDRIERVVSVIEGRRPDRTPVSFWHHFSADQVSGPAAVAAHLSHVEAYDLDFLKVMNDNEYPHPGRIHSVADLGALKVLRGDEAGFARQLGLIADLKRELGGRLLMPTTVFSAWTTLRKLTKPPTTQHNPPSLARKADPASQTLLGFYREDPSALRAAIETITASLANFAGRCLEAGADGIFLSVRDDWLADGAGGVDRYEELLRQSDRTILAAAQEARLNILHVCGNPTDFRAFASYPVHVINWADRAAGPTIGEVRDWIAPAICGGVDNLSTLPNGTPEACEREVADAIAQAADRPIMIGAGCTFDPHAVSRENLLAVARAAHG